MPDRPPLAGRLWYDAVFWSSFTFFTFGFSLRRSGWGNMPRTGPVLGLANHQSMFDPVLVGLSSRRYLSYLARKNLFEQPLLGPLIRSLNAIPIDRNMGKEGIQAVLKSLDQGRAVLMFPEGERTPTGEVLPLKPGVALLIKRVTCPIVPICIAGCFAAWSRFRKWPRPSPLFLPPGDSTIAVSVGEPIDPARYQGKDREWIVGDLHAALVRSLVEAGAIYYSDEFAVINRQGRVHPFARPLSLRPSGAQAQVRVDPQKFGASIGTAPLPVALVLLTRFAMHARWRPRTVSQGQGVLGLLANTPAARKLPKMSLDVLTSTVSRAAIWAGPRGEAVETVQHVLEWLENRGREAKDEIPADRLRSA